MRVVVVSCPAFRQLVLGERRATGLVPDEAAQHVIIAPEVAPAIGHEIAQEAQEITNALLAVPALLGRERGFERAKNGERPAAQRPAVLAWHAQEIPDHFDGNRGGEILDQIEPGTLAQ
jgi:hypothetical protein